MANGPFGGLSSIREQEAVLSPTPPRSMADLIASALAFAPSQSRGPDLTFGQQVESPRGGLLGTLGTALGALNPNLLASESGLAGMVEPALQGIWDFASGVPRVGIEALAGQRIADLALGPKGGQPATAGRPPASRPAPPAPEPEAKPEVPGAFAGRGTGAAFQIPKTELPELQQLVAPSFAGVQEALGPAPEMQQIGQAEQLSRLFGGQAGGGLQAIQGAPQGRAATVGEVIAGIGAGGAQAQAISNAEQRQLQAVHEEQIQRRQMQLANIQLQQELVAADVSETNALMYNQRVETEAQMERQRLIANHSFTMPVSMGANGYFDPVLNKVVPPADTRARLLMSMKAATEITEKYSTRVSHVGAYQAMRQGLHDSEKLPFDTFALAINGPERELFANLIAERIKAGGGEEYADTVLEMISGTDVVFGQKEVGEGIASDVMGIGLAMVMEEAEAMAKGVAPESLPYGGVFIPYMEKIYGGFAQTPEGQFSLMMGAQ